MMKSDCLDRMNNEGLILFGCGKMGSALLSGWLANGVKHDAVSVIDPRPSKWLKGLEKKGVTLNGGLTDAAACILAVKPQMLSEAGLLDEARDKSPLFISIAAGTTLASLSAILGHNVSIVRSMPNTPALIGQGVSALIGNDVCRKQDLDLAVALLETVGQVITINDEEQMDVVTGVSGSGPAYLMSSTSLNALPPPGKLMALMPMWPCNWQRPPSAELAHWHMEATRKSASFGRM